MSTNTAAKARPRSRNTFDGYVPLAVPLHSVSICRLRLYGNVSAEMARSRSRIKPALRAGLDVLLRLMADKRVEALMGVYHDRSAPRLFFEYDLVVRN